MYFFIDNKIIAEVQPETEIASHSIHFIIHIIFG